MKYAKRTLLLAAAAATLLACSACRKEADKLDDIGDDLRSMIPSVTETQAPPAADVTPAGMTDAPGDNTGNPR